MADGTATDELKSLESQGLSELTASSDEAALRAWNTKYFGDKGLMKAALGKIGTIPKEQRAAYGQEANRVKVVLTEAYEAALAVQKEKDLAASLTASPLDVTLPGRPRARGRLHPATQILRQITAVFADMGFQVYRSREVETDAYNFEFLNMPEHHPARDMWDTFFTTTPGVVLRTHTSPGLPQRGDQHPQRDPVLPGRGAGHRRGRHDGRPEGHHHRLRAPPLRPRAEGPHSVELLPVHRAVDRGGHRLAGG
jgi:phenylalanyl-tRNA synthetase alpha chain